MSQINDALRRASNASRGVPGAPPPAEPPPLPEAPLPITEDTLAEPPHPLLNADDGLPPVIAPDLGENHGEKSGSKKGLVIALLFVLAVAAGCGFSVWRKHRAAKMQIIAKTEKKPVHPIAAVPQALSNMQAKIEARSPVSESNKTAPATSPAALTPPSKPAVTPASVANSTPAKFPPLRLQSIFYRPSNPSVMINGKLLCIADEIQGVLVADIQPSSVTLVLSGYTNVLTLR